MRITPLIGCIALLSLTAIGCGSASGDPGETTNPADPVTDPGATNPPASQDPAAPGTGTSDPATSDPGTGSGTGSGSGDTGTVDSGSGTTTPPTVTPAPSTDALQRRVRAELKVFTDWLKANQAKGFIGEMGWPDSASGDSAQWNALANLWYQDANAAGLWVTTWATGEWWGNYKLAVYEDLLGGDGVDSPNSQAATLESHPSTSAYLRGVNVAGADFASPNVEGTSSFSNTNPGAYNVAYHYDSAATFQYLATRGIKLIRLPFRWERLQPQLNQALDATELQRMKTAVAAAGAAGLKVVLDMHNYAAYYLSDGSQGVRRPIGSSQVPVATFADVWQRISREFQGNAAVVGYGLMNEPVDLPSLNGMSAAELWESASQAALNAIRQNGDTRTVLVAGYFWSGAQAWPTIHPDGWITDSAQNFRYEAHHYWDRNNSGSYSNSYASEVSNAQSRGY